MFLSYIYMDRFISLVLILMYVLSVFQLQCSLLSVLNNEVTQAMLKIL